MSTIKGVSLSTLDQLFFSGSSFIINILYARFYSLSEYGEFSTWFAVGLMTFAVVNSLAIEPVSVLYSTKEDVNSYLVNTILFSISITLLLVFVSSLVIMILGEVNSKSLDFVESLLINVIFFWNYQVIRRFPYILKKEIFAVGASFIFFIVSISVVLLLFSFHILNPFTSFYPWLLGSLVSTIYILHKIKIYDSHNTNRPSNIVAMSRENWNYGKWLLGTAVVNNVASVALTPLLGIFISFEAAGLYKIARNFVVPLEQFQASLGLYFLPKLSQIFNYKNKDFLLYKKKILILIVCTVLCYSSLILFFEDFFVSFIYGMQSPDNFLFILSLLFSAQLLGGFVIVERMFCKVLGKTKFVFAARAVSGLIVVALSYPIIQFFFVEGAAFLFILGMILELIVFQYMKFRRRDE